MILVPKLFNLGKAQGLPTIEVGGEGFEAISAVRLVRHQNVVKRLQSMLLGLAGQVSARLSPCVECVS